MSEREAARDMLRELLHEALAAGPNGSGAPVPQVPAPPVAAVLRPSTWSGPPAQGEVVGGDARTEPVALDSDADLARFVQSLLTRFENPREREAIRAGKLRFSLGRPGAQSGGGGGGGGACVRIERGAVTERAVDKAAKAGARLVLGPRAVLTPLARDKARAKGIQIERET
jgi:hypothetical protein